MASVVHGGVWMHVKRMLAAAEEGRTNPNQRRGERETERETMRLAARYSPG